MRRSRRFAEAVQCNLSPPRMRYDDVVLDLADRADDALTAVGVLADACGGRRTVALEQDHTVRLGYGQVFARPCSTAAKIGALLRSRGWRGRLQACPDRPEVPDWGVPGRTG